MSAITAKASRKMKKYAVLTREPRCFLGSFDLSWEQRKVGEVSESYSGGTPSVGVKEYYGGQIPFIRSAEINSETTELFLTEEGLKNSSARLVALGDILYALYGATSGEVGRARLKGAINQAILAIKPHTDYDSEYLAQWLRKSKHSIIETYLQGGQGNLSGTIVKELSVDFPSLKEQKAIGDFFRQLDNLITLHQRKCALLFSPFQSFISMMFTTSTFSWEQRKLTEFVEFFSGLTYTPNDVQENGTLVLRSSNVSNGEVVDADNIYVNPQVVNSENVKVGDIVVVVRNGSRSLIGKHAQIKAFMPNTVIGAFMTGIRSECPEFTNALLNTSRFEEEIAMNMGATINQITGYMFSKMEFKVPCLDEQKKIGEYFEKLDNLITLHQRKCIFFTGRAGRLISTVNKKRITSSWEQRKVGNLLIERNQQAPMSDEYPLMAFIANEGVAPKGERYDRSALVTDTVSKLYKKTEKGDFIYSSNNLETGSIGLNKYGKACISPVYSIFEPTGIADSDFLGRRLVRKDFINAMVKWRQGVIYGQWRIHESDFLKIEITVPSVEEQRKIGAYLDQLDNLITLHQRKPFLMKWRTSDANRNQPNRLVL